MRLEKFENMRIFGEYEIFIFQFGVGVIDFLLTDKFLLMFPRCNLKCTFLAYHVFTIIRIPNNCEQILNFFPTLPI